MLKSFDVKLATKTTANITEGSNLYFTNSRADARITNALLDEDNMASDSATKVATQQSIKAYVDNTLAALDLDFAPDSGTGQNIVLGSETMTMAGGRSKKNFSSPAPRV